MPHARCLAILILTAVSLPAPGEAMRCGTPPRRPGPPTATFAPADCGYWTNAPQPEYEPGAGCLYDIPVVVHVIQDSSGAGFVSAQTVQDQIDILNEDFQAIPGTPGAPGTNAKIRFHLATVDPAGNPTTGITYSTDDRWFVDQRNYWDTLAWDTNRYLNIYTNDPPGLYGYVPDFPQSGVLVGDPSDRVVINWQSFGRDPTPWWPGNMGRTATHEVGHYFGLYHTFDGGCGDPVDCYGTSDLICDTAPEDAETRGCPASKQSCGSPDPFHNYMDYSDDICLWEFTPEQVNRARCTLAHWRPDVYAVICTEIDCADGIDNEADGSTDCDDPDCFSSPACGEGACDLDGDGTPDGLDACCDNAADDDLDGDLDCADADCALATPCLVVVEDCGNGMDDDADTLVDCDDPECFGPACGPETNCGDGQDNDGDGAPDCLDSDCFGPACGPETDCGDGEDNDGDGAADCLDSDCFGPACGPETDCGDGQDNDGDGAADCLDSDCFGPGCEGPDGDATCLDGSDNDGDALVDCQDPDCRLDDLLDCDGDGEPNGTDCQPANPLISLPPDDVRRLDVTNPGNGDARVAWSPVADASSYGVLSGLLSELRAARTGTASGACAPGGDRATSALIDTRRPAPVGSDGHWYVVRAQNPCPGSYGLESDLDERPRPATTDCIW